MNYSAVALFATLTSGVEIYCFYWMRSWSTFGSFYTCGGTVISAENATTVTDISATHMEGKDHEDVKGFYASSNHLMLATIPAGIEKFFANLEFFEWANGNLFSIDSSTFEPFPNLLVINLGGNKIVTLDGDLFQHTRKLRQIDFVSNSLEHVGHDFLTGLTDLEFVNFSWNPCIDASARTPQQIQELNLLLTIQCPPLAIAPSTTTSTAPKVAESFLCFILVLGLILI